MSTPHSFVAWLFATYVCVVIAVAVDFVTGVRKARKGGVATTSRGYKMTCDKAVKYFLPMLCLSCIDYLASIFLVAPFLTMSMAVFNIFCEWKSVMESTHDKQEIHRTMYALNKVLGGAGKHSAGVMSVVSNELEAEVEKIDCHEKD